MLTRSLGRSDLRLSEIALGTWGLGASSYGKVIPARFEETVRAAMDEGVTTFDVAPLWGEAEKKIGEWTRGTEAVIVTRGGARRVDGKLAHGFETDALVSDCEGSLERMGREHVDLWLLHDPGEEVLRQDAWKEAIDRLESDGKIRAWGVSVGSAEEARMAIAAGAHAICLTYNLLYSSMLEDLSADIATSGCGVLARSPLMYGLLAGQWAPTRRFPEDDHRARRWNKDSLMLRVRQVNDVRFLVGERHRDLATAALRFVLNHNAITCAIVGARTRFQIESAVQAADGPPYLADDEMMRLAKIRETASF
jgi:aryl-alcohol dehydrogenase-like predicted oxidoreductase